MFLHGFGMFFRSFVWFCLLAVYMLLTCFLLMLRALNHDALRACSLHVSQLFVGNASSLHQSALPVHMSSQVYVGCPLGSQRLQDPPRWLQDAHKTPPRRPKIPPRQPKIAQDASKTAQDAPKTLPRRSKTALRRSKALQDAPKTSPRRSQTPQDAPKPRPSRLQDVPKRLQDALG